MLENIIFERDYTNTRANASKQLPKFYKDTFDHIVESGFFQRYDAAKKAMPKYVVPKIQEAYEDLLARLNFIAQKKGGKIRGIVDYTDWVASIDVVLPFFECCFNEDFKLLSDIADKTINATFAATEDGDIHLHLLFRYFEDIGIRENLIEETIMQDDKLVELLIQQHEEEKKFALSHPDLGPFLDEMGSKMGMTADELYDMLDGTCHDHPDIIRDLLIGQAKPKENDDEDKNNAITNH